VPINQATLSSGGSVPKVEIRIGQQHFGKYEIFLYDATGKNPKLIGGGINTDTVPDIFDIGHSVPALAQTTLFWQAVMASPTGATGGNFSVDILITQDGNLVGRDTKTGPLSGPNPFGFIRLIVG